MANTQGGLKRIISATRYSAEGLLAALRSEAAFRLELYLAAVLIPLAFYVQVSSAERALLIASVFLILIVELINSGIEAIVDRISLEKHPLSKKAKDVGSAAVFMSLVCAFIVWVIVCGGF